MFPSHLVTFDECIAAQSTQRFAVCLFGGNTYSKARGQLCFEYYLVGHNTFDPLYSSCSLMRLATVLEKWP